MKEEITTDLSSYKNGHYNPGAGFLKRGVWYLVNVIFFRNPLIPFYGLKIRLLRLFGANIGQGVIIKPSVNIKYPWNLTIGNYVWIGEKVWIDNLSKVSIENNVCISQSAMLICGNHDYTKPSFNLIIGEIKLEEGCWIGAGAIIGPGVIVHSHAILSLGSIATSDLDRYTIYRGNPAKIIKQRILMP